MISEYLYVNPTRGLLKDQANRMALLQAVNVDQVVKQAYFGRGTKAHAGLPVEHDGRRSSPSRTSRYDTVGAEVGGRSAAGSDRRPSPSDTTRASPTTRSSRT